mmetsp:Transcript_8751/g.19407  ORF Transcript_8751/g.19407 Transcript_8751/m.19407 type:complete len:220 (+) Transcript_8751:638-1297(+)
MHSTYLQNIRCNHQFEFFRASAAGDGSGPRGGGCTRSSHKTAFLISPLCFMRALSLCWRSEKPIAASSCNCSSSDISKWLVRLPCCSGTSVSCCCACPNQLPAVLTTSQRASKFPKANGVKADESPSPLPAAAGWWSSVFECPRGPSGKLEMLFEPSSRAPPAPPKRPRPRPRWQPSPLTTGGSAWPWRLEDEDEEGADRDLEDPLFGGGAEALGREST